MIDRIIKYIIKHFPSI